MLSEAISGFANFMFAYFLAGGIFAALEAREILALKDTLFSDYSPLDAAMTLIALACLWPAILAMLWGGNGPWRG